MSTPQSISSRPRQPVSPFQTFSFSNRDASPRAASLARLTQTPPIQTPKNRSGTATPTTQGQSTPLLQQDFRKIDPKDGTYGSFTSKHGSISGLSRQDWVPQEEDPEIIKKHLVSGFDIKGKAPFDSNLDAQASQAVKDSDDVPLSEEFSSLQLQGGDITRQVYRFAEQSSRRGSGTLQRSQMKDTRRCRISWFRVDLGEISFRGRIHSRLLGKKENLRFLPGIFCIS